MFSLPHREKIRRRFARLEQKRSRALGGIVDNGRTRD